MADNSGAASDDQQLAHELLAGWPAPQNMFEVRDLTCTKLADRVEATVTVVNKNEFAWAFGVETVFYTKAGEPITNKTDPGFWEPDQAVELSDWMTPLDDFDDEPRCEINVYHGVDLAFRSADKRAETYERLGWNPTTEQRTDGS